jgi:hypothetical protein
VAARHPRRSRLGALAAPLLIALFGAVLSGGPSVVALAADPISEQDAHSIGVAAYLYFYPLVTMDITRKQLTNVAKAEGMHTPMNSFASLGAFPPADMKIVVRPNFHTLYTSAWLDLTMEPMIVSAPDTAGRYYLLPMLDMWTDVFASQAGARPGPKRAITRLYRPAGATPYRWGWSASTRPSRMSG